MNRVSNCYFSELIGASLLSCGKNYLGKVKNVFVNLGRDNMNIVGARIKTSGEMRNIFFDSIDIYREKSIRIVVDNIKSMDSINDRIIKLSDLLDRQIFDRDGVKLIRVNDLKISGVAETYKVSHIDIGAYSLLRRLGINKIYDAAVNFFKIKVNPYVNLISINNIKSYDEASGYIVLLNSYGNVKFINADIKENLIQEYQNTVLKKAV